jgi:hypothetical protein
VDQDVTNYVLQELLPAFENLDSHSAAILAFLKERGIATDEAMKPYFEQASLASSVKWRAIRARLEHLLAPSPKTTTEAAMKETEPPKEEGSETDKEAKAAEAGAKAESKPSESKPEDRNKDSHQAQQQGQKAAKDKSGDRRGEKAEKNSEPRESARKD